MQDFLHEKLCKNAETVPRWPELYKNKQSAHTSNTSKFLHFT